MSGLILGLATLLLAALLLALQHVGRSGHPAERLLAVQLIGSTAVAILLLLAESQGLAALRDVALLSVLLAAVLSAAMALLSVPPDPEDKS